MKRRWKIKNRIDSRFKIHNLRLGEIVKLLFKNRGLKTKEQIGEFFDPPKPWSDKVIKKLAISKRELSKAVLKIKKAIKDKKRIVVYGDYDADGICGTAILWETLYSLGAKAMPFIPDREKHGYGLSKKGVDEILNNQPPATSHELLVITVDNGIVAHKAVEYARSKGIDVIVTDHHQKKRRPAASGQRPVYNLPKAEAVVWSDKVCGTTVAWVLAGELLQGQFLQSLKEKLDLVAIATVGDLMPLLGPNRSIVKHGLEQLNKTKRVGLNALFKEACLKKGEIETWQIGFVIAPRINAMGRLEDALDSLRLLCTKSQTRAEKLAQILGTVNRERQELTLSTFKHASQSLKLKAQSSKLIFIAHQSYNQGIIGLVAGKLAERFYRPAIVVSKGEVYSKASVRSIDGFNIIECLRTFEDIFEDIGGHPMAAGFTVKTEKLPLVQQKLEELAAKQLAEELLQPSLEADCEINLSDINYQLFKEIRKFTPFGMANPRPTFVTRGIEVVSFRQVGKEKKHLKLRLKPVSSVQCPVSKSQFFDAIYFNGGTWVSKLSPRQKIDVFYTIDENSWNGNKTLQLKIKDIKKLKKPDIKTDT